MEPVATVPLTAAEIRKDWAKRGHAVSRQYVAKLIKTGIKGERLPLTSLDDAWLFRTRRTTISKLAGGGRSAGGDRDTAVSSKTGADTMDDMLDRVKLAELKSFERWQERLGAKEYDAILAEAAERAWKSAASTRAQVESLVEGYKKKAGRTVDVFDMQLLIDERLSPLRSALHGLDRELAKELFPEAAAIYRPRIRSVIARTVVPAIALAKRRLAPAPHGLRDLAA